MMQTSLSKIRSANRSTRTWARGVSWVLIASAIVLAGCSREVDSSAVGFVFEPPKSMKFESDSAGPPPTAQFENGLEIRSVKGTLAGGDPQSVLAQVKDAAKLSLPETFVSSKTGTIPAGNVVRYELKDARNGALLYVVQGDGRYLTVTLTAPKDAFDTRVNQLERAMSTLRFR